MNIDGSCHCGQVRYQADVDSENVLICHCTDCQTLTGTAFRTAVLSRPGGFKLLSGELKTYTKTSESGVKRLQTFCPECGTPIYSSTEGDGQKVYSIRAGTARQRRNLVPRTQIWCRSAQEWITGMGEIASLETQPSGLGQSTKIG